MTGFTYKSYNFVDKDPIIDEIRTIYENSGVNYRWIAENSGVSTSTIGNWFDGTTRRPQAASINAVLRALGYKLGIVEMGKPVIMAVPMAQSTPKPRHSTRHVVQMHKYRRKKHG